MEGLILQSMQKFNIFPITSHCDSCCVFCSHHQNPPEVQVYSFGHRDYSEMVDSLEYLDPKRKIVIGESATKLIEGEPFAHPEFLRILAKLREYYPKTLVSITTNGNYLNHANIEFLKNFHPVELNLSINALTLSIRKKIMGKRAQDPQKTLRLLKEENISYNGSLVAMPWITGWEEISETVIALEENNASTVRIFLPGYTKLAPKEMQFPLQLWDELHQFILKLREKHQIPITLDPPQINDLNPQIIGVIKGSPAWKAGIQKGDIILRVNDMPVYSRVEAFENSLPLSQMNLKLNRFEEELELEIKKDKNESPGFVLDYDFAPETVDNILERIQRNRSKKVLILVSQLAYNVLTKALEQYFPEGVEIYLEKVPSNFFGGSIMAAGLLVVEDFKCAIRKWLQSHNERPDLILLPAVAFDHLGKDLTGKPYWEIEDHVECSVEIV